jgi:hypothetical protein
MDNAFKDFGCSELLAYSWKRWGAEGIHRLLKTNGHTSEYLTEIAAELERVGLTEAAALVATYAETALPADDLSRCPYMEEPYTLDPEANRHNVTCWLRSKRQRLTDNRER